MLVYTLFIYFFFLSQNEYIELVGFDDIPEEGNALSKNQNKRERRRSKKDKEGNEYAV